LPASAPGSVATMRGRSADARPPPEDARARVQEAARGPNLASTSRSAGSGGEGGEVPNAVSAGGVRWGEGGGASVEATPAVAAAKSANSLRIRPATEPRIVKSVATRSLVQEFKKVEACNANRL